MASHLSVSAVVALIFGRARGVFRLCALFFCVMAMGATAAARADIYKWTDKDGILHYSDVAPTKEQQAKDVVVSTRSSNKPPQPPGPSQQELLARIQSLELQLQAQRYDSPQPASYPTYYAPPAPPPAPYYPSQPVQAMTYYDAGYSNAFDNSFFSPFLSAGPPFYVVSSIRTHGSRFGFGARAPGHGSFHGGHGGWRGGGGRGG